MSDVTAGVQGIITVDNDYVIAQTSGELTRSQAAIELNKKEAGFWGERIEGEASWSADLTTVYESSSNENLVGADGVASLAIDDGSGEEVVEGLQDVTASLEAEVNESADIDDPLWRYINVVGQSLTIDTSGTYRDPDESPAIEALMSAQEAGNSVDFTFTFGVIELVGTLRVGDWSLDFAERGDDIAMDLQLHHDGPITRSTGTLSTGQEAIMAAFFDRNLVGVDFQRIPGGQDPSEDDTPEDQTTVYSGDGYVTGLDLSVSRAEDLNSEITIEGDGALDRSVYTAA